MTEEAEDIRYPAFKVLLVDDDGSWLHSLRLTLACAAGITNVITCEDSGAVPEILEREAAAEDGSVGLVLLDITMPEPDGEALQQMIAERHPEVMVIIISGLNQTSTAVRCIKRGAFDYFVKTDGREQLIKGVLQAVRTLELQNLNREMRRGMLSGELRHPEAFSGMITVSPAMLAVFRYVEAVAPSSQPVLVTGESGVGKELLVRAIHTLSGRRGPLISLNVAGLDDASFSDTLFGHKPGAFTGAVKARRGLVERAAGGTLFLDEIGDLSPQAQIKLLRLLQEGEFYPLGSDHPSCLEARIVVATNRDLTLKEGEGTFRRDLYYRLHVHHVHIPPLRERPEDIPALLAHFVGLAAEEYGKPRAPVPDEVLSALGRYDFPGNVRELRGLIFDVMGVHGEGPLPTGPFRALTPEGRKTPERSFGSPESFFAALPTLPTLKNGIQLMVDEALRRSNGNQTLAARMLGISQPAMSKRMRKKDGAESA